MRRIVFILVPILVYSVGTEAIDISATGGWSETVNELDLVSGAGSDLIDIYESTADATTITISNCTGDTDNWRVDVRRVDGGNWDGDFILYVKRTSEGQGNGTISGEFSYLEVLSTDTELFSGAGDRSNISIQYKLTGMSISVPPDVYSKTVVFTMVDIP